MNEQLPVPEKRLLSRRNVIRAVGTVGALVFFGEIANQASQNSIHNNIDGQPTPKPAPSSIQEGPPVSNPNLPSDHTDIQEPLPVSSIEMPRDRAWIYDFKKLSDGQLPRNNWRAETGTWLPDIHEEAEIYTDRLENVRIENGELVLEAHKERYGGRDFTSARINTHGIFDFTYGTLEVDMKLPAGVGTWPAAWLMPAANKYNPSDYNIPADDPFHWALNGEIDFMEAIGSIPNENIPAAHNFAQLHRGTLYTPGKIADAYGTYHRYGVVKSPDKIAFTIDGQEYASRVRNSNDPREWPYDQPYYLILNLAMGGTWAGEDKATYPPYGIDETPGSWQMRTRSISYTPF